jgi:hypothetical protein
MDAREQLHAARDMLEEMGIEAFAERAPVRAAGHRRDHPQARRPGRPRPPTPAGPGQASAAGQPVSPAPTLPPATRTAAPIHWPLALSPW